MTFLNPVDITTIVGVVTEEKLGSRSYAQFGADDTYGTFFSIFTQWLRAASSALRPHTE